MPWTLDDVEKHTKGLTDKQKRVWVRVANDALSRCIEAGGTDETCAPRAIRQANAAVKGVKESVFISEAATIKAKVQGLLRAADVLLKDRDLPQTVKTQVQNLRATLKKTWSDLEAEGEPEDKDTKPEGGEGKAEPAGKGETSPATEAARWLDEAETILKRADSLRATEDLIRQALEKKFPAPAGKDYLRPWIRDFYGDTVIYELDGRLYQVAFTIDTTSGTKKVILGEPKEVEVAYVVAGEAARSTKTEDGKAFPASDYAYVPDPEKPSTWKLRLTATPGGPPDPHIVGAAIAALGKGFRGQKVEIPAADLPKVKAKVRAAWKKANPDKDEDEMPPVIREADEGHDLAGEFVPLIEKAVRRDGTVPIKIIQPGWGASGYYSKETLERDGPKVFTKGLKMYWDHPTATEEAERPERSLRDLAGEFVTDAKWRDDGPAGPGLYADAKIFGPYKEAVNELAPHIGVSIRALGKAKMGEADGRQGPIIERIVAAKSVDFVTTPGAGGKIVELFEAARGRAEPVSVYAVTLEELKRMRPDLIEGLRREIKKDQLEEAKKVTEQELEQLREANKGLQEENARLKEALILREAKDFVGEALGKVEMPDLTRTRLLESLSRNPVVKDGKLDKDEYAKKITEAVKAEMDYLAQVTKSGAIRGMGSGDVKLEEVEKTLQESFARLGLSESAAKIAAKGRG